MGSCFLICAYEVSCRVRFKNDRCLLAVHPDCWVPRSGPSAPIERYLILLYAGCFGFIPDRIEFQIIQAKHVPRLGFGV